MNCMVFNGFGAIGVWLSMGGPSRHYMLGLSQTMHVHIIDHYGIVMSWGHLCWFFGILLEYSTLCVC